MKAVLVTGRSAPWMETLGVAWPLLPFGNRLLIEYWFEFGLDLSIREFTIVLGDGAAAVEEAVGNGQRWGVAVSYSFLREDRAPRDFLRRAPARWRDGLLLVAAPLFPRRLGAEKPAPGAACSYACGPAEAPDACLSADPAYLRALLEGAAGAPLPAARPFAELGVEPAPMARPRDFFEANMRLVSGEGRRYVSAGYSAAAGSPPGSPPQAAASAAGVG